MIDPQVLAQTFTQRFGVTPTLFRAPGRVNLIGEHTDYNDGFVLPAAIGFYAWVAAAPRDDGLLNVASVNFAESKLRPVSALNHTARPSLNRHWSDYVFGVARCLQQAGVPITGANLLIEGDVPLGSGLSSSAALETATAVALTGLSQHPLERSRIAQLCQQAENEDVGMRCGIMDQFASIHGVQGHAILLDCRSLHFELVPFGASKEAAQPPCVVVCNTMVRHQHAGGEYNDRRQQCESAVRKLSAFLPEIHALRDVSPDTLARYASELSQTELKRARHVVSENARVHEAAAAMRAGNFTQLGHAMRASHHSLRDDYEVSCPELDLMVDLATQIPGVYGARMTGGGFGGCTVNLVQPNALAFFCTTLSKQYTDATGMVPEMYCCDCVSGAGVFTPAD